MKEGEEFSCRLIYQSPQLEYLKNVSFEEELEKTINSWKGWTKGIQYEGEYQDLLERSALLLKALSFISTGAIIAAPTTSLPESYNGDRNWDYRYGWVRDSIFTISALTSVGQEEEAKNFFNWILKAVAKNSYQLRVGFDVKGEVINSELELPHLNGFNGIKPVRIGNKGLSQFQLDNYGEFLICLHHCWKKGFIEEELKVEMIESILLEVLTKYKEPDQGIWEMRSSPQFFVHSQAMAYLGLEKGFEVYKDAGGTRITKKVIQEARHEIYRNIYSKGVDRKRACFVQSFDSEKLDSANLRLPLMGFIAADDPIMINTVNETIKHLFRNGMLYRYLNIDDGIENEEGGFLVCGFWLVQNLILQKRYKEAKRYFEIFASRANDLGLFGEEFDSETHEFLGNFPQALTHIGLINSIVKIKKAQ